MGPPFRPYFVPMPIKLDPPVASTQTPAKSTRAASKFLPKSAWLPPFQPASCYLSCHLLCNSSLLHFHHLRSPKQSNVPRVLTQGRDCLWCFTSHRATTTFDELPLRLKLIFHPSIHLESTILISPIQKRSQSITLDFVVNSILTKILHPHNPVFQVSPPSMP